MTSPTAERTPRLCDVCGILDTHPRHAPSVPPNYDGAVPDTAFLQALPENTPPVAVAELMDPSTVVRHMDCCASRGCQICQDVVVASGGASGDDLLAYIQEG